MPRWRRYSPFRLHPSSLLLRHAFWTSDIQRRALYPSNWIWTGYGRTECEKEWTLIAGSVHAGTAWYNSSGSSAIDREQVKGILNAIKAGFRHIDSSEVK
jgi:hypothetical protein